MFYQIIANWTSKTGFLRSHQNSSRARAFERCACCCALQRRASLRDCMWDTRLWAPDQIPLPGVCTLSVEGYSDRLAPVQALERLAGILESEGGSITLMERGDLETVPRAPGFRLFAAMNPATDAGASLASPLGYAVMAGITWPM